MADPAEKPNENFMPSQVSTKALTRPKERIIHVPVSEDLYIKLRKCALDSRLGFREYVRAVLAEEWVIPLNESN